MRAALTNGSATPRFTDRRCFIHTGCSERITAKVRPDLHAELEAELVRHVADGGRDRMSDLVRELLSEALEARAAHRATAG